MIQRQCPQCGSELVRARRTDPPTVPGIAQSASPGWRCSVCGGGFTTEQIRESNRARSQSNNHRADSTISSNAGDSPQTIELSGTGTT